jgi:hypothetical protein
VNERSFIFIKPIFARQGKSLFFHFLIMYVIEKQLNKLGASPQLEWWNAGILGTK